jgi:DNA repair exonuclease SbcCD nuclease subunit
LTQIVYAANVNDADILCSGDFFDHVQVGHKVVNGVIDIIGMLNGNLYLIAGQHDMTNHRKDFDSSPLGTILYQDNVFLLDPKTPTAVEQTYLYGCSWEDKPVVPKYGNSILLIHKSITPEEPPFFLTDAISAEDALVQFEDYMLVVSGDYHSPFVAGEWGNLLINCGPMLRESIDQMELQPKVWLVDTDKKEFKEIPLSIEKADVVFSLDDIPKKEDSKFSEELSDLVQALKNKSKRPKYKQIVNVLVKKMKPGKGTIRKVKEFLKEAENG